MRDTVNANSISLIQVYMCLAQCNSTAKWWMRRQCDLRSFAIGQDAAIAVAHISCGVCIRTDLGVITACMISFCGYHLLIGCPITWETVPFWVAYGLEKFPRPELASHVHIVKQTQGIAGGILGCLSFVMRIIDTEILVFLDYVTWRMCGDRRHGIAGSNTGE
jgi:hypothetical protein